MNDIKNDIERYINGEMSSAEMNLLEKRALSDPFLADALEGASNSERGNFAADIKDLERRLYQKTKRKSWFTPIRIAASIIVFVAVSIVVYRTLRPPETPRPLATLNPQPRQTPQPPVFKEEKETKRKEKVKEDLPSINQTPAQSEKEEPDKVVVAVPAPAISSEPKSAFSSSGKAAAQNYSDTSAEEEIIDVARKSNAGPPAASAVRMGATSVREVQTSDGSARPLANGSGIRGKVSVRNQSSSAHVSVKGTSIATETDALGNYTITPTKDKKLQQLIFSSDGFQTTEVDANGQSNINVQLSDDSGKPAEVVVGNDAPAYNRFDFTTEFAAPAGGTKLFDQYLEKNLHYPAEAMEKKIQGKVLVSFMTKKDSTLSDFRILHGIGSGCDEELIRLIKEGPKWSPLRQSDNQFDSRVYVRYKFVLPK